MDMWHQTRHTKHSNIMKWYCYKVYTALRKKISEELQSLSSFTIYWKGKDLHDRSSQETVLKKILQTQDGTQCHFCANKIFWARGRNWRTCLQSCKDIQRAPCHNNRSCINVSLTQSITVRCSCTKKQHPMLSVGLFRFSFPWRKLLHFDSSGSSVALCCGNCEITGNASESRCNYNSLLCRCVLNYS